MRRSAAAAVRDISSALRSIPARWTDRQRLSRCLLGRDPLERLVPGKLLSEGVARLIEEGMHVSPRPRVLFMDRAGGGDGAGTAAALIPLISGHWPGFCLILVSFATPSRGVGALVRNMVVRAGAAHGVEVYAIAHNRPFEGLPVSRDSADRFIAGCDLVITFSPGGAAGLSSSLQGPVEDPLLSRSHLAVLSYPDPESTVAQLPDLSRLLQAETAVDALRFWVQIAVDGPYEDLGTCVLGAGGDAEEWLWVLLDNARRHRYRVLIEPLYKGVRAGDPLVCPCRSAIEKRIEHAGRLSRIVPAGNRLVAVARGEATLC